LPKQKNERKEEIIFLLLLKKSTADSKTVDMEVRRSSRFFDTFVRSFI
jgi:hypothetical protein